MSPGQAAARLREIAGPKGFRRVCANALRRSMTVGRKEALTTLRSRGVGRALWVNRNNPKKGISGTPPLIVTISKVRFKATSQEHRFQITSGLQEKGMAALIERGGMTEPHKITPKLSAGAVTPTTKRSQVRLFIVSGSRWSMVRQVNHPGSRVPAVPHLQRAAANAATTIPGNVERGVVEAVRKAGL